MFDLPASGMVAYTRSMTSPTVSIAANCCSPLRKSPLAGWMILSSLTRCGVKKEGILLWALEGLHRLIRNNYRFTISERTAANLKEAMEQGNNILGFLKSEGYFEIRKGAKCKSTDFYKVYERWCLDNLEKPLAASTFIHHLKDNQKSLGIVYDDKCIGTNRGFHNVDVDLFLPIDVPSPWD